MYTAEYRIHFVNGSVIYVAECNESENPDGNLIDRFRDALPHGLLEVGCEDDPTPFIPADKILYITRIAEDCIE